MKVFLIFWGENKMVYKKGKRTKKSMKKAMAKARKSRKKKR